MISVLASPAIRAAYNELAPHFEKRSGEKIATEWAGMAHIRQRVGAGEAPDLVIGSSALVDELVALGRLARRIDLCSSGVAIAVRAGAPRPDIGSTPALVAALRKAKSIGYSSGPSGVYLVKLFERLGIAEELRARITQTPPGVMVGGLVASGEIELGFQQVSELMQVGGIDLVGPLPADIQVMTNFSAGLPASASRGAEAWAAFLRDAAPVLQQHGLQAPVKSK